MSASQKILGGRYQFIQTLNVNIAGQTFLAADVHYPGHPKCVVRQIELPTRNPMTRKFILSLLKKKVEVLEVIGQHEQVPSTFAAFDVAQSFYIVQEYVPGRSLNAELTAGKPWSQSDVLYFLKEVLPVITFAQEHGVVHGNLKPSKLIRHQVTNRLMVLDFGAIKTISQNVANKRHRSRFEPPSTASRPYLAPEQLQGQALFCSDHYALGMLAIQALTGLSTAALPTVQQSHLHQSIIALLEGIPNLGTNTANLLIRMVHPNPQSRYQKASEILADLERLHELGPPASHAAVESALQPTAEINDPKQPRRSTPWGVLGAAGFLLLATLAAGTWALKVPQRFLAYQHRQKAQAAAPVNPKTAIAQYTQAIALLPHNPEAFAQRSQLYAAEGNTEAALADITQAIEQVPDNPLYVYDRGNLRFTVGDTQGAIADYTQAIRKNPDFVKAYVNRGSARAEWGDDQGAVEDYTQALQRSSTADVKAAALLNRCLSYSNLGDQVLALDDCTAAINLRPSDGLAYQNRGLVRRRLKDFQGSLQDYNIAIKIEPEQPDPYYNRGLTRQAMGDNMGAMEDFSQAIAIDPDFVFAIYDRGLLQAELGNLTAAITDLRQAAQLCLDLSRTGCYEDAQYSIAQLQTAHPELADLVKETDVSR